MNEWKYVVPIDQEKEVYTEERDRKVFFIGSTPTVTSELRKRRRKNVISYVCFFSTMFPTTYVMLLSYCY